MNISLNIPEDTELEILITNHLRYLGIPANLLGYTYLRYSIFAAIKCPDIINNITKVLYVATSEHFNTTPSRCERAIRHAIESGLKRCGPEIIARYFANSINKKTNKPTNSEFIATVSDYIRIRLK